MVRRMHPANPHRFAMINATVSTMRSRRAAVLDTGLSCSDRTLAAPMNCCGPRTRGATKHADGDRGCAVEDPENPQEQGPEVFVALGTISSGTHKPHLFGAEVIWHQRGSAQSFSISGSWLGSRNTGVSPSRPRDDFCRRRCCFTVSGGLTKLYRVLSMAAPDARRCCSSEDHTGIRRMLPSVKSILGFYEERGIGLGHFANGYTHRCCRPPI